MKKLILFCALICSFHAHSQSGDLPFQPGGQSGGMGSTQVANANVWATHHNPGLLPWTENISFGIAGENRFFIPELMSQGFAAIVPLKNSAFGLSFASHGFSEYRRSRVGLSYGIKLSDQIAMGIGLNYDALNLGNFYGSSGAVSATIGFSAHVNESLTIGASAFNPFGAKLSNNLDEYIPSLLALGANYKFSDKVSIASEIQKDINQKPLLKFGLDFHPAEILYIRTGFKTGPQSYTFGLGLKFENLSIDIANWFHPVLGSSPLISLQYQLAKKE